MLNTSWRKQAACAGADLMLFMPDENNYLSDKRRLEALAYCDTCKVRRDCLEYAYDNNIQHGVWGGLSTKQRRKLKFKWKAGEYEV